MFITGQVNAICNNVIKPNKEKHVTMSGTENMILYVTSAKCL